MSTPHSLRRCLFIAESEHFLGLWVIFESSWYSRFQRQCNDDKVSEGLVFSPGVVILGEMQFVASILPYIQIALSILLITAILLQQRGAGLGGAFGGDNFGAAYYTRRGAEKWLFYGSIVLGILFAISSFLALLIQ